jgi:hypothetical protein
MTVNNLIFSILFLFFSIEAFSHVKVARINDSDGYSFIRKDKSLKSEIVDKVFKDELFYADKQTSEWIKVRLIRWDDFQQIEGYIHHSRVQFIEDLTTTDQKDLLSRVLKKHTYLATNFRKVCSTKLKTGYNETVKALEGHHETKYEAILQVIPIYFAKTSDRDLLTEWLNCMWADRGSASESPSFALGECFRSHPDIVLNSIVKINNTIQRQILLEKVEWGLLNIFEVTEGNTSSNKEFNRLCQKLKLAKPKNREAK